MPPIDPPMTAKRLSTPRWSISAACARTMSRMVTSGKSSPQAFPVAGLTEAGPEEPRQPPITFEQMTKKRSVSSGQPGPTSTSHQPGLPVTGLRLATCWSPVSAWQTSTALERAAFSVP